MYTSSTIIEIPLIFLYPIDREMQHHDYQIGLNHKVYYTKRDRLRKIYGGQ